MSEWRVLKTGREAFEALENGEEIEAGNKYGDWLPWAGRDWDSDTKYRARPKDVTVTVRRALFQWSGGGGGIRIVECDEAYAAANSGLFVCWLGDPITYPKGGA